MSSRDLIIEVLQDRPVAYRPGFARIAGGVEAGVFLSQLFYWSDKGHRDDGFIYKTQDEWEAETGLTRARQVTARKQLRDRGLISEHKHSVPARLHYCINFDAVIEALSCRTSVSRGGRQAARDADGKFSVARETIPEITSEITPEISGEDAIISSDVKQEGEDRQPSPVQASPPEKTGHAALDEFLGPRVERAAAKGSGDWATPAHAGGADSPAQMFVDKLSLHYGMGGWGAMPKKKRRQWASKVSEAFKTWGGATTEQAGLTADAYITNFSYRTSFNPYEKTCADNVGQLLMQVRNGTITQQAPRAKAARPPAEVEDVVSRRVRLADEAFRRGDVPTPATPEERAAINAAAREKYGLGAPKPASPPTSPEKLAARRALLLAQAAAAMKGGATD